MDPMATDVSPGPGYEYKVLTMSRFVPRGEVTRVLTEQAEYGRWELARVVVYFGGARRIWLRRRILRVQRTDFARN